MASNGFDFTASRKATILSKIKETADFSSLHRLELIIGNIIRALFPTALASSRVLVFADP